MLSRESIADIRKRCEAATPGPWMHDGMHDEVHGGSEYWVLDEGVLPDHPDAKPIDEFGHRVNPNYVFAAHARQDIPALLDALEEAEAQISGHCKAAHELGRLHADMIADRDRWKARAEALQEALEGECDACTRDACQYPCGCIVGSGWVLDEARFSKQEDAK